MCAHTATHVIIFVKRMIAIKRIKMFITPGAAVRGQSLVVGISLPPWARSAGRNSWKQLAVAALPDRARWNLGALAGSNVFSVWRGVVGRSECRIPVDRSYMRSHNFSPATSLSSSKSETVSALVAPASSISFPFCRPTDFLLLRPSFPGANPESLRRRNSSKARSAISAAISARFNFS